MVIAVGTLKKRKGFDLIIEALSRIATSATLVICGEGEELGTLRQQANAAGLTERVVFTGNVGRAAIPDYFAAADVFVHAAELEAAGNVVLEALASGCGVVVTDSGGPARTSRTARTGSLCPWATWPLSRTVSRGCSQIRICAGAWRRKAGVGWASGTVLADDVRAARCLRSSVRSGEAAGDAHPDSARLIPGLAVHQFSSSPVLSVS